jgi:hypothetical protein
MHAAKLHSFFLLRMILQGLVVAGQFVDELGEPASLGPTQATDETLMEQERRR